MQARGRLRGRPSAPGIGVKTASVYLERVWWQDGDEGPDARFCVIADENVGYDGERGRAGRDDRRRALERDAADGHDRLAAARSVTHQFEPARRVARVFRHGRKNRTDGQIGGVGRERRINLRTVVCREANDRIRADDLVPSRRIPPASGWRRVLYRMTFGLVNAGPSPEEIRQAELEARIRGVLRGHYKIGVMGKGGVGKTTMSASIGSIFAELRQEDRVVAIDADTSFGKLGSRVDPKAVGSYWELASDQHLDTFADVRSRVGNNAAGLFVLAGEASPARRRVLEPAIYREATSRLDRYFSISIIDCSSTMDSAVTQEVLRDLDALVVVSSPWVDGAATAGQTMDWLANRGLNSLLHRTVVVLNDSDGHADKRTRGILTQQFAGQGQVVVEVPFDGHLRPGGVIAGTGELAPATRRKFIEIAAALAEHFPASDDRRRDRH